MKLNVMPVFFDFEMTNLNADFGRILCGSFKSYGQPSHTYRIDETPGGKKEPWNDRDLCIQLRDAIEESWMILSYNGVMFDIKYLNSRLLKHRERVIQKPLHRDMYFVAKTVFAISSNRLASVQEFLGLDTTKTRLDPAMWNRAAAGDKLALNYVVEHCEADVAVLEEVFEHLIPFIKEIHA